MMVDKTGELHKSSHVFKIDVFKISALKNFAIFMETPVLESLFNKVLGLRVCKRL